MCGIQHTLPTGRDTCVVYSTHCPQGGIHVWYTAHTAHREGYMCGIQHTLPAGRDTCTAYSTHCPQGGIHVWYTPHTAHREGYMCGIQHTLPTGGGIHVRCTAQQAHTHTVCTYVCTYIRTHIMYVHTHIRTHARTHTCTHLLHWCTLVLLQCKEEGSFYTKSSSTQDSITAPSVLSRQFGGCCTPLLCKHATLSVFQRLLHPP